MGMALAPGGSHRPVVSGTPAIRVVIAHHWALLREGLLDFLSEHGDVQVAAEACDSREALAAAEAIRPEILLVDLALVTDTLIANIRRLSPRTKILLLGAETGDEALQHALRQGARGYLAKSTGMGAMLKAIRAVHAGEAWIERTVMGRLLDGLAATSDARAAAPAQPNSGNGVLSRRERHVANLVATGLRNKEIAQRLGISEKTVKAHLVSVFRKLQLRHRLQLAVQNLDGTAPCVLMLSNVVLRLLGANAWGIPEALGF